MSTDLVVETLGLQKRFGTTTALDGIDLVVRAGEVHGFLGPNGAGKSTTIRVLLGLLRADGGTARVLGRDPWADAVAVHREIAYVPGDVALWPTLSGGEAIDLITRLRGGADTTLRERLIRDFDLDPTKKARSYSKGNRQKVALIAAFARPARLYILDEPTSGLDPLMEEVFRHEVERVREDGASVLLSSHLLDEVEKLCERVTILRAGRVVESGTLAELRHLTRTSFRVGTGADPAAIAGLPGVHDLESEPGQLAFDVDTEAVQQILQMLVTAGVSTLTVTPPSLESLFLRHYGSDPADTSPRAPASPSQSASRSGSGSAS